MRHLRVVIPNEQFAAVPAAIAFLAPNESPADDDFAPECYRYRLTPEGEAYLAARDRAAAFGSEASMTNENAPMRTEGEQAARDRIAAYVAAKSRERERCENSNATVSDLPSGVAEDIGLTIGPSDERETRLRALFQFFFLESGLTPDETTISALVATVHRLGYAFVPIRR